MKKITLKKQQLTKSLLILTSLFIMASCSVEKRQHLSGYHVTWKKNKRNNQSKQLTEKDSIIASETVISKKIEDPETRVEQNNLLVLETTKITPENLLSTNSTDLKNIINHEPIQVISEEIKSQPTLAKQKIDELPPTNEPKKKVEFFSLLSFISAVLILGLFFAFLFSPIGFSLTGYLLVTLAEYLIIASVIFGIIGLIRIKANKDKFKGKAFAIIGLAIGGIFLLSRLVGRVVNAFRYY